MGTCRIKTTTPPPPSNPPPQQLKLQAPAAGPNSSCEFRHALQMQGEDFQDSLASASAEVGGMLGEADAAVAWASGRLADEVSAALYSLPVW